MSERNAKATSPNSTKQDVSNRVQKWNVAKSFTVRKIWDVGIANDIEWLVYKTIQFKLFAVLNLNTKVNKPLRLSHVTPH